jgi:TetR/AcrR family transcriptional regulator
MEQAENDTKERIFAAAEAEFLVRGYDGARMQAIADRAQINKAMLHYHFGSKDELFAEVFKQKAKLLFPRLEASLREETDFIRFACSFVELYISHLIENPFLPAYLFQVSSHHPELLEHVRLDLPEKFIAALSTAMKQKKVRAHDPRQFMVSLLGMCVMPFVGKNLLKHGLKLDEPQYLEFLRARVPELKRYVVLLLTPEEPKG